MKTYDILVKYMKENGLSQKKFCELCGINVSVLRRIKNKNPKIKAVTIYKICFFTGISADFLLGISQK